MKSQNYYLSVSIFMFLLCMFFNKSASCQNFKNVAEIAGISHVQVSSNLFGGGVAVLDYNNDGFEDIYLTGGTKEDKLYKNNGDGTFLDVSLEAQLGLKETVKTSGAIAGDINNDGFTDIFVTTESSRPNLLYINQGNGTFEERSEAAGIKGKVWSTGAAFGDYNQDGLLDIYVINYIKEAHLIKDENGGVIGFGHDCYNNQFYVNNGDETFSESAGQFGIENTGCGLAITFTDYNGDNKPDIYIANDFGAWITPNTLYENQYPQDPFKDQSAVSGLNCGIYGMGIAVGDINNDGKFDYYVTNIGKNVLFKNNGDNTYQDITDIAGVGNELVGDELATGWGTNFFDYDLDGYEDIFVANGFIPSAEFIKTAEKDPNKLYRNLGNNSFEDLSEGEGLADTGISRGSATFDYDNDGDLDLIVTNLSRSSHATVNTLLYENRQFSSYNWLKLKLEGRSVNRSALGAKAILYYQNKLKIRELSGGSSHGSNNSSILHFGLGHDKIDSLQIIWPGGNFQFFKNMEVNQSYYILEGEMEGQIMGCTDAGNAYFNPKASYNSGCYYDGLTVTSILNKNPVIETNFRILPNPIAQKGKIYMNNELAKENVSLLIFDVQGRLVYEDYNIKNNTQFDKGPLNPGCYVYRVFSDRRIISIGRLSIK